jgi:hypothetical protein
MTAVRGQISLLAIGAIFVVVFGGMYLGVQYAEGDLLHREPTGQLEEQLRDDLRATVDAERAARGLDPAQRDTSTRVAAQDTARWLATVDYFAEPTAVGPRSAANHTLPNGMGFCHQLPARLTVAEAGWPADADAHSTVPAPVTRAVAERATALLASAEVDAIGRTNSHKHGIGVAVDGDVVYVVYRTCNLGY